MAFKIGEIPVEGEIFLSPMANISDSPYRLICRRMGAGFSFTEFVSTDLIIRRNKKALAMFRYETAERPIIFQIYGNNPDVIVEAAKYAEELGADVVDLNMGCSCTRMAHRGSGAGLLRDPAHTGSIIERMRKALKAPVTAKIRLGWDPSTLNYLEVARMLEDRGAAMISVHGRTKVQAYKGEADWEPIGEIKAAVNIPVLGNGDITDAAQAREKIRKYGVDGVLVGRGGIGNPWVFAGSHRAEVTPDEIARTALGHFRHMLAFYENGLILFRKHAARYFSDFPGSGEVRSRLVRSESVAEIEDLMYGLIDPKIDPETASERSKLPEKSIA